MISTGTKAGHKMMMKFCSVLKRVCVTSDRCLAPSVVWPMKRKGSQMLNDTESESERLSNGFINKRVTFCLCYEK